MPFWDTVAGDTLSVHHNMGGEYKLLGQAQGSEAGLE